MIELLGMHGTDHADVVDDGAEPGHEIAHPLSALPMFFVVKNRPHHLGCSLDKGKALSLEVFLGAILTVKLGQGGLVLEKIDLRRGTRHVQVNDRLGLSRDSKVFSLARIGIARKQVIEGDGAEAQSGLTEKVAPGNGPGVLQVDGKIHGSGLHEGFIQVEQHAGEGD